MKYAMTIEDSDDWTRLYLGPARDAALLEIVTVRRGRKPEMVIHAMKMRPSSGRILLGGG